MKKYVFVLLMFAVLSSAVFATDDWLVAVGFSSSIADFFRYDPQPYTHSFKYTGLGFHLSGAYLFTDVIGAGIDISGGRIYKIETVSGSGSITTEGWDGSLWQFILYPSFLYSPFNTDDMRLILGIGPAYTRYIYFSDYGIDAADFCFGISCHVRYLYCFMKNFFWDTGFRFSFDFGGSWADETTISAVQFDYIFFLGVTLKI